MIVAPGRGAESPTTAAVYRGGISYGADAHFLSGTGPDQLFRLEPR